MQSICPYFCLLWGDFRCQFSCIVDFFVSLTIPIEPPLCYDTAVTSYPQTQKEKPNKVAILSRYVSILAVGQKKDINSFMQYTVYQLFDEFKRYELKLNWDIYLQAKMAGAKDLKEVDDWMKDIHSEELE